MIKGYFPVSLYAKMDGISVDTAWHRVLRNGVESIIGKDGERYVYYEKKSKLDEDFVTINEYCILNDIPYTSIWNRIVRKKIPDSDIKRVKNGSRARIYIRRDYAFGMTPKKQTRQIDGYLTVEQWAKKNGIKVNTTRHYVYTGRIPSLLESGRHYIKSDYVYIPNHRGRPAKKEK